MLEEKNKKEECPLCRVSNETLEKLRKQNPLRKGLGKRSVKKNKKNFLVNLFKKNEK